MCLGCLGRRHNAPGVRGADFRGFTEFRLNDDGEILLSASLTNTIPDFKSWPLGLWFGAPEALSLVALGDQQAPDLSDGVTYGEFQLNGISLANQNRIAFATKVRGPGTTEKNNLCLFAGSGEGEIRLVYREGSPLPGFPDAADVDYAGFNFAVCDSGRVVMQMTDGIYAWEDGELSSIAREGDAAPGFPDSIINNFAAQQPVIDPSGRIAFGATLRDLERERNTKAVYVYDGSLRVAAGRASRIDLGNGEIAVVSSADIVNSHITNNSDGRSSSYNSRGQLLIRAATAKGSCDAIVETDLGVDGLHNVIRATIYSAGDMVIAFETEFGKRYLVERSLDGRTWEAVGGESEGNGSELTIVDEGVGAITKVAFYRIVIRSV